MDRGAWQATVHGVGKSQTQLSMHTHNPPNNRKRQGLLFSFYSQGSVDRMSHLWEGPEIKSNLNDPKHSCSPLGDVTFYTYQLNIYAQRKTALKNGQQPQPQNPAPPKCFCANRIKKSREFGLALSHSESSWVGVVVASCLFSYEVQ